MIFQPGDILIAASDVPKNADLRSLRGPGRILHFGDSFKLKRTLATGTDGLVIGIAVNPLNGDIYATDASAKRVVRFSNSRSPEPIDVALPAHKFGTLTFGKNGGCWLGVHNLLGEEDNPHDLLWHYDPATDTAKHWPVEFDGGKLKFHRISFLALAPLGNRLLYASENGRRVMSFNLAEEKTGPDFLTLDPEDPRGTFGLEQLSDGRVIMATGIGASLFDDHGRELLRYPLPAQRGWSRAKLSNNEKTFFVNNFLEGIVEKRQVDDGTLVHRHDIQQKHALCGIVEYPEI